MTPLQYRMLELVLEIDEICQKHDIVYYLAGGSVLGAVRHKGFIPWDDDIDIMMTRQNFLKFQKACETEMRDDREIITMINTPCHTKVTIKYMNKSTCQFFRSQVLDTTGCGISLDIMILDPLPKAEADKEQHIAQYIVYNELLTPFFMVNEYLYKHVPLYNEYHDRIEKEGRESVMKELYTCLFEEEHEDSEYYLYRWGQMLLIYEKTLFGKPRYLDFEDYRLPVPEKTIDFLRATYGDNWIYLPPEQNRETHVSNMNPNIAYINWLKDFAPFLDREKVLNDFIVRKKYNVKKAIPAHDKDMDIYRQNAILIQLEMDGCSADTLASMNDEALIQKAGKYLTAQLSGGYMKNGIYIDIGDEKLASILSAILRNGDFAKAGKLLKARNFVGRKYSDALQSIAVLLDEIRKYVRYFEDRYLYPDDVASVSDMAADLMEITGRYPEYLNLQRCLLQLYLELDTSDEDILRAVRKAKVLFPEDPEIAFWAGCLYEKVGDAAAAGEQYKKAGVTANGVILQKLKEMEGNEK